MTAFAIPQFKLTRNVLLSGLHKLILTRPKLFMLLPFELEGAGKRVGGRRGGTVGTSPV